MVPGTPNPYSKLGRAEVTQAAVTVLPCHMPSDIYALQQADSVIHDWIVVETKAASQSGGAEIAPHWRYSDNGIAWLRRMESSPDGAEAVFQLLFHGTLKKDVLTQVYQERGHKAVARTLELLRWHTGVRHVRVPICQGCQAGGLEFHGTSVGFPA